MQLTPQQGVTDDKVSHSASMPCMTPSHPCGRGIGKGIPSPLPPPIPVLKGDSSDLPYAVKNIQDLSEN